MATEKDILSKISVWVATSRVINESKSLVDYKTLLSDNTATQKAVLIDIGHKTKRESTRLFSEGFSKTLI